MNQDYIDGLNTYYNLKLQYEDSINKMKKTIANNENLSWKEKRRAYKKMQPKCVQCHRSGGSIFQIKYDTNSKIEGMAIAMCKSTPKCNFSIEISLGNIITLDADLIKLQNDLEELRIKVIKDKNDLLFGFISTEDALEKFDTMKNKITENNEYYEVMFIEYLNKTDNTETNEQIKKLRLDIYKNIQDIKNCVYEFEKSHEHSFINDSIVIYTSDLQPNIKKLHNLLYHYNSVRHVDNTCKLVQKKITIEDMEANVGGTDTEIIKMNLDGSIP